MSQMPTDYQFRRDSALATGENAGEWALGREGVRRLADLHSLFVDSAPDASFKNVPKGPSVG